MCVKSRKALALKDCRCQYIIYMPSLKQMGSEYYRKSYYELCQLLHVMSKLVLNFQICSCSSLMFPLMKILKFHSRNMPWLHSKTLIYIFIYKFHAHYSSNMHVLHLLDHLYWRWVMIFWTWQLRLLLRKPKVLNFQAAMCINCIQTN